MYQVSLQNRPNDEPNLAHQSTDEIMFVPSSNLCEFFMCAVLERSGPAGRRICKKERRTIVGTTRQTKWMIVASANRVQNPQCADCFLLDRGSLGYNFMSNNVIRRQFHKASNLMHDDIADLLSSSQQDSDSARVNFNAGTSCSDISP